MRQRGSLYNVLLKDILRRQLHEINQFEFGGIAYAEAIFLVYTKKMKYNYLNITDIYLVGRQPQNKKPIDEQSTLTDTDIDDQLSLEDSL